jgi:hypothetical protein
MESGRVLFAPLFVFFALGAVVLFIGLFYVLPIILGIRCAHRKNYSALWMLFAIHPLGGWITFIVLSCLPGRTQCVRCGGFLSRNWRIWPFCQTPVTTSQPPLAGAPPQH